MATSTQTGVAGKATFTIPENSGMIEVTVGGVSVPFSQSQNDTLVTLVTAPAAGASVVFTFKQLPSDTLGLPTDENGNLVANVNHRYEPLADLKPLGGGAGEISVANDADAIVVHNGTPGQADVYYKPNAILYASTSSGPSILGNGTAATVNVAATIDPLGRISAANDTFAVPNPAMGVLSFTVKFGASALGTYRRIVVEQDVTGSGSWVAHATFEVPAAASALVSGSCIVVAPAPTFTTLYRLRAQQDSTVDQSLQFNNIALIATP